MEKVIIYIIVAVIIVVNIIRNYQKEKKKNQGRVIVSTPSSSTTPPIRPFSRPSGQTLFGNSADKPQVNQVDSSEPQINKPTSSYVSISDLYSNQDVVDFSQEGTSVLAHLERTQKESFPNANEQNTDSIIGDLELSTSEDCKRAFIHSIIFERKY
jgi:hypothetical protein